MAPQPKPQEAEVSACEWLDLEEFLSAEWYSNGSMLGLHLHAAASVCHDVLAGEQTPLLHNLYSHHAGGDVTAPSVKPKL